MKTITLRDREFVLHPYGAAYWRDRDWLLIADVHLGKTLHFRKNGMAVPLRSLHTAFEKLEALFDSFLPKKVLFLGDLFHSHLNAEYDLFKEWLIDNDPTSMMLITGNHDILSPHLWEAVGMEVTESWEGDGFRLTHEPEETNGLFNICGHVHPGIQLRGPGKQSLKLPCFYQRKNQLILPAFGEFTGNYILRPTKEDRVFAVTPEEVIHIGE